MIAGLKPYPAMKESGVPWLGEVPAHWEVRRLKHICLMEYGDSLVSEARQGGAIPVFGSNGCVGYHNASNTGAPCIIVGRKGSFGKVHYSPVPAFAIDTTFFIDARVSSADIRWLSLLLSWLRLDEVTKDSAIPGLDREDAYQRLAPLPPLTEQSAIARFLDHADRRIRRYIRAKEKLIALLEEQRKNTSQEIFQSSGAKSHRLKDVADLIKRPIDRVQDEIYTPIGLYNRGRGIFKKQARSGSDLGDSDFFWIEEGDLVISGQFAWEGAIALASNTEASCVASHRYPILRGKLGILDTGFLLSFFQTGWGHLLLDHHSRGAAGRNRPLNARTLMKEKMSLPPLQSQLRITEMLRQEYSVRQQVKRWSRLLGEYRARLIADVVTGKLDVREAAATLPKVDPLADNDEVGDDLGASEAPAFDHEDQPAEVVG